MQKLKIWTINFETVPYFLLGQYYEALIGGAGVIRIIENYMTKHIKQFKSEYQLFIFFIM